MKLQDIGIPITHISGVGQTLAAAFAAVNVFTVSDLLTYYPRTWEDRTQRRFLSQFAQGKVHTAASVISHEWFGFGRMKTLKIIIGDGSERGVLVCFNRPFLQKTLPVGAVISVSGKFSYRYGEIQSSAFEASVLSKEGSLDEWQHTPLPDSAVYSVYPLTEGLTQTQVRKAVSRALKEYTKGIENEVSSEILVKHGFLEKAQAIKAIHMPADMAEALSAKRSIIFEELYLFQKAVLTRAAQRKTNALIPESTYATEKEFFASLSPRQKQLAARLPFALTQDQRTVVAQMNADIDAGFVSSQKNSGTHQNNTDTLKKPFHMARLLQGDVGSGKTLTAFFAALRVIDWGAQCAFLAPTELLSRQHAENASRLLEPLAGANGQGVRTAFLTGNVKNKNRTPLLQALKNGEIDIVLGTHALFSKNVLYRNLKLVIIDEQHRFGVVQRATIIDKGRTSLVQPQEPAVLMMSATPIPQTLAHTLYGDLDVSVIKTMPQGRKSIRTYLTKKGNEQRVYEAVREELKKGHQAYFIYPRIAGDDESGDKMQNEELKSAENMYRCLSQQIYPEFSCALIHSKIEESEQERTLHRFQSGDIQVLAATSVVEVGVDVANATCMVIEQAERFGLAALHQLRGRVGRGSAQSFCFLIYGTRLTQEGKARLKVLHESTDGFFIAEEDLRLRGPGEVGGIQQSGYLTLGLADPVRDKELLALAHEEVQKEVEHF
ncbi:ATP-dependent DNA helicase RecG [Treponema lecithinolyticum]|uniref:ATP-dependent DNA helicase RecG n=1 Tax=Treponema lecithinolyticum TaxID=53418 RepID=UPI0028E2E73D|nr:ATP-dependent DNA helicase RecG [Treponema lecithinolyticum]